MRISELLYGVRILNTNVNLESELHCNDIVTEISEDMRGKVLLLLDNEKTEKLVEYYNFNECNAELIVCEKLLETFAPSVVVHSSRVAYALMAKNFYGKACDKLRIALVTGTNGKTSTSNFIYRLLSGAGIKTGVIGTIGAEYAEYHQKTGMTTPDPLVLHKILYEMYERGADTVVIETSAHALELNKLYGINANVGVFTNLGRDHYDFFGYSDKYKRAKEKLFSLCGWAVINYDDDFGKELVNRVSLPKYTYSTKNANADLYASGIDVYDKLSFTLNMGEVKYKVAADLNGKFNVYNLLAAIAAVQVFGISIDRCAEIISSFKAVSGRFECVENDIGIKIIVDYAHTPEGLKNVLECARQITKKRLICVFGCGGDRDKGKRREMGEISAEQADLTVITTDNPRSENPLEIIGEIEKGAIAKKGNYVVLCGRKNAIEHAISVAKIGDTVIVCGKGQEDYMEIAGIKYPYSDFDAINSILKK